MNIQYINQIDIKRKKVLIRVDFNVPLNDVGAITDDTRIRAAVPTINHALDEGAKIILISHLGRPKGKRDTKLSLSAVAKRLGRFIHKDVLMAPDCVGNAVDKIVNSMKPGDVVLLENLRFHSEETENDEAFGKQLANLADVYINDAFATAHRAHASNIAITKFIKVCGAGLLMKSELAYFSKAMENPTRPLVSVVGGKKVSDKIGVLLSLCDKIDKLVIGGGMGVNFIKARGYEVGKSFVEESVLGEALKIIEKTKEKGIKLYLPVDFVVADRFDPAAETKVVTFQDIPRDWMALDIGPASVKYFSEAIQDAKTIIWNGPMGVFEMDAFSRGTYAMVNSIANTYALTIVGGGDTNVAVHHAGESDKMSYISTGGGAFLTLLEGKKLPGLEALEHCQRSA
ncbi:MAG: phosphoglycerate kinase [Thermodesulfobacteriota bacterium]